MTDKAASPSKNPLATAARDFSWHTTTPSVASGRGQRVKQSKREHRHRSGHIEQNSIIAAQHSHVDGRLTELQVA